MKQLLSLSILLLTFFSFGQEKDTSSQELTLLFIGDIMGHGPQITSAYDSEKKAYDYDRCFKYITEEISAPDYSIGNLEVTLAGPPFKGYPQFSSPDNLALACQNAGMDVLVTSNNHSCDRGGKGIIRTIEMLDSFNIMHTGTFLDTADRNKRYPLIIENDCMRIAILNYTYGTNGLPYPEPTVVNMIDKELMKKDLEIAKSKNVDKIIVVTHWGSEYKLQPVQYQIDHGQFLFDNGADIIIGGHPHVLEKMIWEKTTNEKGEELIVYSLGNFVSNQRKRYTDGGAMFKMTLSKDGDKTSIKDAGYMLTWVHTPIEDGKKRYYILPAAKYENNPDFFKSTDDYNKMKSFIKDSRVLFNAENKNVPEYIYEDDKWKLNE
ncbi:MAG: poly-gamma-glutamate capsule biosynthesis protein CapA/YwtB (metallophosphatase superfamily) [Arenicella sp.]|jgi:poly-gamma-glutamate capsule biosynthesis protein CapA/YwtB (metallophosphatase superfamily)